MCKVIVDILTKELRPEAASAYEPAPTVDQPRGVRGLCANYLQTSIFLVGFGGEFFLICAPCAARHASPAPSTKYSISICSNSRLRNMKLRGVISFRNAFPI